MARQQRVMPLPKLIGALNPAVRVSVRRRFDAMIREYIYLQESRADDLAYLGRMGWTEQKLGVLFVLNCVYQIAIGPLRASTRSTLGLGQVIPIVHGVDLFDTARANEVSEMAASYRALVEALNIKTDWLTKNTAGDLVYWIKRYGLESEDADE